MRKRTDVGVTFDFDGTLLPIAQALNYLIDSKALPPEGVKVMEKVRETYLPKALAATLTPYEEVFWIEETVRTYVRFGLNEKDIVRTIAEARLKPGAHECLARLHAEKIPVAIISYGCRQFVQQALRVNCVEDYVDRVYAMDLHFNESGTIVGYNPETTVTPTFKGVWSRQFARELGVPCTGLISVGDGFHGDRRLGSRRKNRLLLMSEGRPPEGHAKYFGAVRDGSTFYPATEWLFERIERLRQH